MSSHLYPHIKKAFENAVVEMRGNYPYFISPFSGVIDPIDSRILSEIVEMVLKEPCFSGVDLIVTFESAGVQLAAIVGHALHIPYLVARKRKFNLENEVSFSVKTNFDRKSFFLYGKFKGKTILIIDDVVSSGATVKMASVALSKAGANVKALFVVAAKTNLIGKKYQDVLNGVNISLISLINVKIENNKVVLI